MCGARTEPPQPCLARGVLPSAYPSTATGVFCDKPAPGRSQAGPLPAPTSPGPGPTPGTPAQTEVPLPPPLLALLPPQPAHLSAPARLESHLTRTGPEAPQGREGRAASSSVSPGLVTQCICPERTPLGHPVWHAVSTPEGKWLLSCCADEPQHLGRPDMWTLPAGARFWMGYHGDLGNRRGCGTGVPWAANTSPHSQFQKDLELS